MIEAHVGLPGSGKSIHAVRKLLAAKAAKRRALANFHSRTGSWEFGLWADITDATNCLVVIDEAHMWFSAREWTKTHQAELSYFQQSRKEGLDLIWVAQHQKRVDTAINELTAYIWDHRRIGGWIVARQYPADDLKRSIGRAVFRLDPRLHRHYWSEERIGFRDGSGYGFGASAGSCPTCFASNTHWAASRGSRHGLGPISRRWSRLAFGRGSRPGNLGRCTRWSRSGIGRSMG